MCSLSLSLYLCSLSLSACAHSYTTRRRWGAASRYLVGNRNVVPTLPPPTRPLSSPSLSLSPSVLGGLTAKDYK